ncbi:hypothetical protein BOTBODRAFT_441115 [Botryobasidium botryosum FD-172 SS1]|uniref:Uncharacterized protein n=1 Tax=Botryobasidium botryosum (strain FD-172 SS1) TaxID=930990 RepID=A0A067N5V3_BOTB1|nr:hypothetical protein BOTBODRAFT_441115 [Botryobasidium botryosum FD-172 SS1]
MTGSTNVIGHWTRSLSFIYHPYTTSGPHPPGDQSAPGSVCNDAHIIPPPPLSVILRQPTKLASKSLAIYPLPPSKQYDIPSDMCLLHVVGPVDQGRSRTAHHKRNTSRVSVACNTHCAFARLRMTESATYLR